MENNTQRHPSAQAYERYRQEEIAKQAQSYQMYDDGVPQYSNEQLAMQQQISPYTQRGSEQAGLNQLSRMNDARLVNEAKNELNTLYSGNSPLTYSSRPVDKDTRSQMSYEAGGLTNMLGSYGNDTLLRRRQELLSAAPQVEEQRALKAEYEGYTQMMAARGMEPASAQEWQWQRLASPDALPPRISRTQQK